LSKVITDQPEIAYHTTKTFLAGMLRNTTKSRYPYQYALVHFQRFLAARYPSYNIESILKPLSTNEINVYQLLDGFVSYLILSNSDFTPNTIKLYITGVRSYLAFYDIDVLPSKFKRKVKMPRTYREDEQALDASDIRKILLSCNNRRLKPYILILASGGMRAVEALAIRLRDLDFSATPTKIHIRKEYSKTKTPRDIYISDEATYYLKQWLDWKYQERKVKGKLTKRKLDSDHLVFTIYDTNNPNSLYVKILKEFEKLLAIAGMDERKEGGVQKRRKITLHSFRRFAKTVISDQTNQDYSEWFLGHNKSPYYTKKEYDRREIYVTKCMKYLTFLDYTTLEATGKNIEAKLTEKDRQMQALKERHEHEMNAMRGEITAVQQSQKELFDLLKEPGKFLGILKAKEEGDISSGEALWWKEENI
jgi:integrase